MADSDMSESAIILNLPVFNSINVHVWFSQLTAIFQAKKITSQTARFAYVVEKLPPEIAIEISDLLDNIPIDKPFDVLREAIIYRIGKSEERRINDLFNTLQLGQSKPTQLLRRMKNLLGQNTMSETLLKKLWLDKLPTHTAEILATLPDDLELVKVAEMADKITETREINSTHFTESNSTDTDDVINRLQRQIDKLYLQVERLSRSR